MTDRLQAIVEAMKVRPGDRILSYDPGRQRFDKILAVRVRAFHVDPDYARSIVLPWLTPRGKLFAVYDEPRATAAGGARRRGLRTERRRS